jgi:soluble lytic murein transglycosylase
VIREIMNATHLNRLSVRGLMLLLALAVMTAGLVTQHQEIRRLREYSTVQTEMLLRQQEWATRAASHLDLIGRYGIPYRYLEILAEECRTHDLSLEFMVGLMQIESNFNPNAQSTRNAYGLMQVRFPTALELDPGLDSFWQLYDPERNIKLGATYFRHLLDRYQGNYRMAALAYNRGPTRLDGEIMVEADISDRYYRLIRQAGMQD